MTELAARCMANEMARLRESLGLAQFLIQHGWTCEKPFHWKDWKSGKVYRVRMAYEIEQDRQERCEKSPKMAG